MTKRIWAGLLALGMALTALPFGIYAEETAWEEEANASEETLDGGLDESAEEFADGLPDYIPEPETDVVDGAADDESADELSEQEESLIEEETTPDLPDFIPEEEPPTLEESELPPVQAGEFVRVTPNTRVYLEIDETAGDDDDGEWYDGNFVNEANVCVEQARQDAQGRTWLLVRYLYGAEEPNGEMAWTDTATVWVLAEETRPSDAADYDVTDYAFPYPPAALYAASDFNLRDYNAGVQTFYPGQQNLYGSSGHDSEYKQIAKLDGYGTIYATPHYLEGQTVYCLEHTMNSPGTKNNASGPFEVVDLDGYAVKPGYSGDIYGSRTMHAIGWVLRHTYPYMIVDTGYADSDVWSRVAGQFAIREVVKQLEGDWYVRDYWRMDEFYRASGQAPGDYLEYARWLAACAIEHAGITGEIGISSKSVSMQNGSYVDTVTLTTDADLIRVSRSVGNLTGNSAGSDGEYYYLRSGDTISVTSTQSTFSITAQSVSSQDEEAAFLIGIPNADIQKVIIPQYGLPAKLKEVRIEFEQPYGAVRVSKTSADNGAVLSGATFELMNGAGTVLATQTTGADGTARFDNLPAGGYTVREVGAPTGYKIAVNPSQAVTVAPGATSDVRFENDRVNGKIRIVKRDALTKETLSGAVFRVLAGAEIRDRQGNVLFKKGDTVVDALTTAGGDASAATGELWPGLYEIVEASPPVGYEPSDAHFFVDARSAASQSETAVVTYEGLKLNIIRQGVYAIVKFLGDNEIHDDAGLIETPEEGAEFELYLKKAGSYGNARAFERDYLVTNRYGYAKTKLLPYGLYVLKQVKGKAGHALKSPVEIFIRGDEDVANPPILTINNQAIRYRLKLIKTDAKTGKTIKLANTAFKLLDSDGNVVTQTVSYPTRREIDTFYTDENGEVTLPETVTRGMYFIEEVQAPQGYLIRTERLGVFVGETGDAPDEAYTLDIEIPNEPVMGRVMVEKKGLQLVRLAEQADAFGNIVHQPVYEEGYLAGAVFELRAAEDIVGKDGTVWFHAGDVADTITTTGVGKDASKELPLGRYELVEVSAPEGYLLDGAPHEVELRYENDRTAVVETNVTLGNAYLSAEITMEKEKEDLEIIMDGDHVRQALVNTPGEGFVFGLFADADMHVGEVTLLADTLVATGATDAEGKLAFVGNFPHGAYYVKELSVPDGWKLNPAKFAVTLEPEAQSGGVIRVSLPEIVHDELVYTRVTLTKTDITGQKTLPGATIEVKDEQGKVIYRETTDANGQIPQIPVTPGTYTFKEVYAPDGYALNEAEMRFTVDADGNVTGDTTIRDDYTRFSLRKVDESGKPLSGVMFGLKKADGMLMMTAKTDAKGMATFEKVPFGTYTLVETQALPGYLKADTEIKITVDGTFVNPKEPITTVVNERQKIRGLKVDTAGQALPGAAFSLINADTGEIVDVAASDEKGEFYLTGFGYGDWIIRETVAPEGFNRVEDVLIHVDEDWKAPNTLLFTDIPNHYEFVKADEDGCPMEGVKFALEDEDGNVLRELVSGEDGIVHADDLKPGVYVIREIETQAGYRLTEETIRVMIDENYIVADELFRLVNFPEEERPRDEIQTGVDVPVTPMMLYGLISMAFGVVLMFAEIIRRREQ